jgi:Flp pilus assembly protein TadG
MIIFPITNQLRRLRADERGTVSILMGFLIIPLVGALGIGFEVSNWYMTTRGMQNAADAATLAAAANGGSNYDVEARAVAAQYGFVDGTNHVSIAVSNTAACPGGGSNCYSVAISGYVPLLLSQVVGFTGDTNLSGTLEKKLSAVAVAKPTTKPQDVCLLALGGSGVAQGIRTNGAPVANMNGCTVMSNTGAQCNGSNLGADYGLAHGTSNGCGAKQISNVPVVNDTYGGLASNIPPLSSSGCTAANSYQETKQGNSYSVDSHNQLSGSLNLTAGNNFMCGDQMLTGDVVINTPPGKSGVLIIENGQLDLNGHTLTTSMGSAVTLVFSGKDSPGTSYIHAPTNNTNGSGGRLDITAPGPDSGPWSGVAIYQDPSLTSGLDVSAAGNSPTWNITGLVYMPHASVTMKGAVDKSTNGKSCFVMVADNFQISGTAGILKTDIGQCAQAGLTMPTAAIPARSQLVL